MAMTTSAPAPANTPMSHSFRSYVELNLLAINWQGVGLIVEDDVVSVSLAVLLGVITLLQNKLAY